MNRPLSWLLASALALVLFPRSALPQDKPAEEKKQDPPKKSEQDDLKERAAGFKKDVTDIRGFKFKTEVKVGAYSRDELLGFLKKEFERESPKEKVEMWARTYKHWGLIPKDLDLYQAMLDLYGSSIAGFYHPRSKELRLIRSGDEDKAMKDQDEQFKQMFGVGMEDITFVHELNHAAQDQNHDLNSLPLDDETNDDQIAAIKGLIEGDASAVGWKFGLKDKYDGIIGMINGQYKQGTLGGKAQKLPAYLRKTLAFPYGYGTDFVNALLKNANDEWSAIDKAFETLPLSTEQILHPKKYYGTEPDWPTLIEIKDLDKIVGEGWKRTVTNVHGEFVTKLILDEFKVGKRDSREKAAEGWDGDRYVCYEDSKGNTCSVWASTWDSKDDAVEFFDLYSKVLEAKYKEAKKEEADGKITLTWEGGVASIERKEADLLVLDSVPAALAAKSGEILTATSKKELKKVDRLKLTWQCAKHQEEKSHKQDKCTQCGGEMEKISGVHK